MRTFSLLLLLFFAAACSNHSETTEETVDTAFTLQPELSEAELKGAPFTRYLSQQDSTFQLDLFKGSGSSALQQVESSFTEESIDAYKPFLVYNADSTAAIDLFSYGTILQGKNLRGGEPDAEAALLDFKTYTRKRLLFVGPSFTLVDATWKGNLIHIFGYERVEEGQERPIIWQVDLKSNTIRTTEYGKAISFHVAQYFSQRFPGYKWN